MAVSKRYWYFGGHNLRLFVFTFMRKEFAMIKAIEFNHNERYCKIMILASLGYFGQFSGSTCELILKMPDPSDADKGKTMQRKKHPISLLSLDCLGSDSLIQSELDEIY